MRIFNPKKARKVAFEFSINYGLSYSYDHNTPMGNIANGLIEDAIRIWLVGLSEEIAPVLPRSLEWLDIALKNGEKFGDDIHGHKVTLFWAKALGAWMHTGYNDPESWEMARIHEEWRWWSGERPWPMNEIVKSGLDDYMAFVLGAADISKYEYGPYNEIFEAGVDMYERWTGKSSPITLSDTMEPRDYGYAVCLHFSTKQSFDEDDLLKAGHNMLKANLQSNWFGSGQYIRGFTWLKNVCWMFDKNLSPLQCIDLAYDDMPDVERL